MELSTVRIMREAGHPDVVAAVVVPMLDRIDKYQLCFGSRPDGIVHTLDSKRGKRAFAKIDSACKVAKELGFEYVSVYMP